MKPITLINRALERWRGEYAGAAALREKSYRTKAFPPDEYMRAALLAHDAIRDLEQIKEAIREQEGDMK